MKTAIRAVADWCAHNPREAIGIAGVTGSVAMSAGAAWLALWLTVRDHTGALDTIRMQQEAQVTALVTAKAEVVSIQRQDAEERRRWQDKSEARDEMITKELRQLGREISGLKGYMQRVALGQGWRMGNTGRNGGAGENGEN